MTRCSQAVAAMLLSTLLASPAEAQLFRVRPPGGVRIRLPFFRLDIAPPGIGYPTPGYYRYDAYRLRTLRPGSYRYDSYRYPPPIPPVGIYPPITAIPPTVPRPPVEPYSFGYRGSDVVPLDRIRPLDPLNDSALAAPMAEDLDSPSVGGSVDEIPLERQLVADELIESARRLERGLSRRRDDADVWIDYLQPKRIADSVRDAESPEQLSELITRYDGVARNPDLRELTLTSGFFDTRRWLKRWVEISVPAEVDNEPSELPPPPGVPESPEGVDEGQDSGEEPPLYSL